MPTPEEILQKNTQALLKKIGSVSVEDLKKEEFDVDATVDKITEGMMKSPKVADKTKEQFAAGKFAGISEAEKAFAKEYEINLDDYKELKEGRFAKMLEDAKAKFKKPDDDGDGNSKTKAEEAEALKALKAEKAKIEEMHKNLLKEHKELKKQADEFPTKLEQEKNLLLGQFKEDTEFERALEKVRAGLKPEFRDIIDKDFLKVKGIGLQATEGGGFRVAKKNQKGEFEAFSKNATEFYTPEDMGEALFTAGIIKESYKASGAPNPSNQQPPTGNGGTGQGQGNNPNAGGKQLIDVAPGFM